MTNIKPDNGMDPAVERLDEARIIALQIQAQAIQVEVTGMEMSDLYAVHNDVSGGKYVDEEYTKRAAALGDLADEVLRLSNEL